YTKTITRNIVFQPTWITVSSMIYTDTLPFVKLVRIKSLNPVPNRNVTPFLISKIVSALNVFRRLRARKYKYKEYITTIVNVLFLSNNLIIAID
ncbi:MAG: hypothetical protein ACXWFC_14180, partial [Nitrososphaeraceae archaeon]